MIDFLCAIPVELQDVWYFYDLLLVAVIAICAVVLFLMRKRSGLIEGQKMERHALRNLKKARVSKSSARRLKIITARNLLKSAKYEYEQCVKDGDMYKLVIRVESIERLLAVLDNLFEKYGEKTEEEILLILDTVIKELEA